MKFTATLQPHEVAIVDHNPASSHVAFAVDSTDDSYDKLLQFKFTAAIFKHPMIKT